MIESGQMDTNKKERTDEVLHLSQPKQYIIRYEEANMNKSYFFNNKLQLFNNNKKSKILLRFVPQDLENTNQISQVRLMKEFMQLRVKLGPNKLNQSGDKLFKFEYNKLKML